MKKEKYEILIVEDTFHYKKGTILSEEYEELNEGIEIKRNKKFLSNSSFIKLNETLTTQDEKRIKEMIRTQLKYLFWQLYSKQAYLIGNV